MDIVKLAINNARLTLSVLVFLLIAGTLAYNSVPKEAEPDVAIPIMYVSLVYQGISPEDSERLLLRPVETKLKSLKGLKEMKLGRLSGWRLRAGRIRPVDQSQRRRCIDTRIQGAGRQGVTYRQAAEEPTVNEVNISEFPVLVVTLVRQCAGAGAGQAAAREPARPHRGSSWRAGRHAAGLARRSRRS